jgi:exopolysaccharide production protein ExoY
MQRHESDLSSHTRGSFHRQVAGHPSKTLFGRGARRSLSGVLQRSLAPHSPLGPDLGGGGNVAPAWVMIPQPKEVGCTPAATPAGPIGGALKRAFDIGAASLVLVLLSPMLLMTALLIKLSMGGPVLFAQPRVGLNGKSFRRYRFSLIDDAEARLNPWTSAPDVSITTLCQVLRRTRIVELPQLINVLQGDMSCVGPRPVSPAELEHYGAHAADYLKARPGLTGLWHVSGPESLSAADRLALPGVYVSNWSLLLDLAILGRTFAAAFKGNPAA